MKLFGFILCLLFTSKHFAQPSNKGGAQAYHVLQEVRSTSPPYETKLLKKIEYTINELERFIQRPGLQELQLLKANYYLTSLEKAHLDHKISVRKADTSAMTIYIDQCKSFLSLETKDKKWLSKQQQVKKELNFMMQSQLQSSWQKDELELFMAYSENRKWYHTYLEDQRLDSLYIEVDHQPDFNKKLALLDGYNSSYSKDYSPVYSLSELPSVPQKRNKILATIEQKKIEDQQRIAAQNKRILEVAKKMQFQECLMHRADSLFEINQLDSAKAIYRQLYSNSASLAHESWEKMKKIESITFNHQRNSVRQQIYQHYLYDTLGRLRIDSSLSIPINHANHIKDQRVPISIAMIDALRMYDANQLHNYHKGKITFQELQNTLPHRITTPSEHLFKLTLKGNTVLALEHSLLKGDSSSAATTKELLFHSIPAIVNELQQKDENEYTYLIPIKYLPQRHQNPEFYYFCNCQNLGGYSKLNCIDQHTQKTEWVDADLYLSEHDEFYFVVTEGRSTQIRVD